MAKKKTQSEETPIPASQMAQRGSRHKDRNQISLPTPEYNQLKELAERNDRNITRELRRIVREALSREGLWPPPSAE